MNTKIEIEVSESAWLFSCLDMRTPGDPSRQSYSIDRPMAQVVLVGAQAKKSWSTTNDAVEGTSVRVGVSSKDVTLKGGDLRMCICR